MTADRAILGERYRLVATVEAARIVDCLHGRPEAGCRKESGSTLTVSRDEAKNDFQIVSDGRSRMSALQECHRHAVASSLLLRLGECQLDGLVVVSRERHGLRLRLN